jgi:hypothetical protein
MYDYSVLLTYAVALSFLFYVGGGAKGRGVVIQVPLHSTPN